MGDSSNFEMLELATGEIILRLVGDDKGYLVKVGFDAGVSDVLGENKLQVSREMMLAGIGALQHVQNAKAGQLSSPALLEMDRDALIQYFGEQYPNDLQESRVLH